MKKAFITTVCLVLLPLFISAEQKEEEEDTRPIIVVQIKEKQGDPAYSDPVAETVAHTLELTLKLMGIYRLAEIPPSEYENMEDLKSFSRKFSLDNIIQCSIIIPEEGGVDIKLQVYYPNEERFNDPLMVHSATFLGIFEATDQLAVQLIEDITLEHFAFGSLSLNNNGPIRAYHVTIDGEYTGENISSLEILPAGDHLIRIYEEVENRQLTSYEETITVNEGELLSLDFSLISNEEYNQFKESRVVTLKDTSFSLSARTTQSYRYSDRDYGTEYLYHQTRKEMTFSDYEISTSPVSNSDFLAAIKWAEENGYEFQKRVGGLYYRNEEKRIRWTRIISFPGYLNIHQNIRLWDGEINIPSGSESRPVTNITWFGTLLYCNILSEMEDLDPCYDLKKLSCDFSKNGYRLPTEAEHQNMQEQRIKENQSGDNNLFQHFVFSEDAEFEFCWDWHKKSIFISGDEIRDFTGPRSGSKVVAKGVYDRTSERFKGKHYATGFRWVRSLEDPERELENVKRNNLKRNGLEPRFVMGLDTQSEQASAPDAFVFSVNYHISLGNAYSMSIGPGIFVDSWNSGWEPTFSLNISPLIIGHRSRFALGITGILTLNSDQATWEDLGMIFLEGFSMQIYIKNVVIDCGLLSDFKSPTEIQMRMSLGVGYCLNF